MPTETKEQIKTIVSFINNKQRKELNKWKKINGWVTDDGIVNDVDVLYHLYHFEGMEEHKPFFMYCVVYIDDEEDAFNSEVKWASSFRRKEFLTGTLF